MRSLLLILCLLLVVQVASAVEIPDPNLRAAIEWELGKSPGAEITAQEMATLTYRLGAANANISDLTGLEFAIDLEGLYLRNNSISDISALAGLTNLEDLSLSNNNISDLSPLAGLTNLSWLSLSNNNISDLSPLAGLTNLSWLSLSNNNISDISALAGLRSLDDLDLSNNNISDLSPLAGLSSLDVDLSNNNISDLSPLAGLSYWDVDLSNNNISDISALAGLSSLDDLDLSNNNISDISALAGLSYMVDDLDLSNNNISDISALAGLSSLDDLDLSNNNISDLFPIVAKTGYWVGVSGNPLSDTSIKTHIPILRGNGVEGLYRSQIFLPAIAPLVVGQTFTLFLTVKYVSNLAGWQLDLAFNPAVLKAISVTEGDFLSQGGGNTFFQAGNINNGAGAITGLSGAFIGDGGLDGTGTLLSITFEAKAAGQGSLRLSGDRMGASNGNRIHYDIVIPPVIVEGSYDLNGDGTVNIQDLILVAQNFGKANLQADANGDGVVDVFDLIAVAQHSDSAAQAPSILVDHGAVLNVETVQKWIDMAYAADDGSLAFKEGITNLEHLLRVILPDKTHLLSNYPNPFNPETWIPYRLAEDAFVTLTIYDTLGRVVRTLNVGHQIAAVYESRSKAIYWDGRNSLGEQVASGIYLYHLDAGDFSATRRMVILK